MGIATVAVYSDADDGALHVQMADEAVHVGGAASAESYLVAERIVQAAKDTGLRQFILAMGSCPKTRRLRRCLRQLASPL